MVWFVVFNFLNVYMIDAVSGAMVFHCNHKKAKGPVRLVHSENWVMVSCIWSRIFYVENPFIDPVIL